MRPDEQGIRKTIGNLPKLDRRRTKRKRSQEVTIRPVLWSCIKTARNPSPVSGYERITGSSHRTWISGIHHGCRHATVIRDSRYAASNGYGWVRRILKNLNTGTVQIKSERPRKIITGAEAVRGDSLDTSSI